MAKSRRRGEDAVDEGLRGSVIEGAGEVFFEAGGIVVEEAADEGLGGLAELLGELEGRGDSELAEIAIPRLLDRDRKIYPVTGLNMRVESAGELRFNGMEHEELRV